MGAIGKVLGFRWLKCMRLHFTYLIVGDFQTVLNARLRSVCYNMGNGI